MSDRNTNIIEEFRNNDGKVGGAFEGRPLLLLHHTGAKSGIVRVNPLVYRQVEDSLMVFASKGGAPAHPHWYRNIKANPMVTVEVGTQTLEMTAREVEGAERDIIWSSQKAEWTNFAEYDEKTDRQIPVIALEPT